MTDEIQKLKAEIARLDRELAESEKRITDFLKEIAYLNGYMDGRLGKEKPEPKETE